MMTRLFLAIGALASALAMPVAYAQQNPIYFGVKLGQMDADVAGFDDATNFGLLFGYTLLRDEIGALAIEGEYTRALSEGDVAGGGEWEVETLAAYAAYRTADTVFLKAKAGLLREEIKVSGVFAAPISGKDSGISFGAGVGYRINRKVGLELEYTVIEDDISFLSLGYFTHF
jgi:opacity protein-like surface antigen